MDAPPVNRLLQLLRQKPSATPEPSHTSQSPASLSVSAPQSSSHSDILSATESDIDRPSQRVTQPEQSNTQTVTESDITRPPESSTQPVIESGILSARRSSRQPVSKSNTQPDQSSTQPVIESGIQPIAKSNTQPVTPNEIPLAVTGLSKGQQRVLRFLLSHRDTSNRSRTIPIGYDAISRHCILSRSGSRKVIGELCQRGLVTRLETKRGETQGSVYLLENIILYATESSIPDSQKNNILYATDNDGSCSSSKELLLQDLVLEGAFQDLHPRSLVSYLNKFDTGEDVQDFLDMVNACIQAAKEGHSRPIQNPHGFLFAQLRAGYINPPEGYKSRKIRAQELRNQQLEAELATLRHLKVREQELQFELFIAQLTPEDLARLEQEAQAEVKPHIGLSPAFQLDMQKDTILKQWFAQRLQLP